MNLYQILYQIVQILFLILTLILGVFIVQYDYKLLLIFGFSQFPKGDRGGSGNVERINAMLHGDAHDVVGCGDDVVGKAVALGAHDER